MHFPLESPHERTLLGAEIFFMPAKLLFFIGTGIGLIIASSATFFHFYDNLNPAFPPTWTSDVQVGEFSISKAEPTPLIPDKIAVLEQKTSPSFPVIQAESPAEKVKAPDAFSVSLVVNGVPYETGARPQDFLIDVMRSLASTTDFSFSGKDFAGLGYFVDEINGKKSTRDYFWILYVNGKGSAIGVSQISVLPGDVYEWKYEKNKY